MKNKIDVLDYATHILKETKKGIIVTTKSNNKVNAMSISWGTLGIEWNKNIFIIFIRENRCTKSMLDETKEFCVNIPTKDIDRNIIKVCGTKSGHDIDKIKELPLILECKVIYRQKQDDSQIPDSIKKSFYPQDVDSSFYGSNKDYHIAYYGEIVDSYIIE